MIQRHIGDLVYFQFPHLAEYVELIHGISTRVGPDGRPDGLNLSFSVSDRPAGVIAAREAVCAALGVGLDDLVVPGQVHSNTVAAVGAADRGRGARERDTVVPDTDGLTTVTPGLALYVSAADCVPLLIYDPVRRAIAAAHAGWRGTVAKIATTTVHAMVREWGSDPADLLAGIGPSIGPCCYAVGDLVIREAEASSVPEAATLLSTRHGRTYFDLWAANRLALVDAGVRPDNITIAGLCTSCRTDLFFSHRAEHGRAGRFGAIIALRAKE